MPYAYDLAYEKFNGKYDLNFNFYNEYLGGKAIEGIDDFSSEASPEQLEKNVYLNMLSTALNLYLNKQTKIGADKSYDLSNVGLGNFLVDFDNLMKGIRTEAAEAENEIYVPTPYAGMQLGEISTALRNRLGGFRSLPDVWAKQIRGGKLLPEDMKAVTDGPMAMIGRLQQGQYMKALDKDLANIVLAKQAMEKAIKSRSVWSYLWYKNWGKYSRESAYLKELNRSITDFRSKGFPVDTVVPQAYTQDLLGTAFDELNQFAAQQPTVQTEAVNQEILPQQQTVNNRIEKKAEKKQDKKKETKKKEPKKKNSPGKVPNKAAAEALYNNTESVQNNFFNIMKGNLDTFDMLIQAGASGGVFFTKTLMNACWDAFNQAENETKKNAVLAEYSKKMFKQLYTPVSTASTPKITPTEKLVVTQKLTDFVMNTYSPAASNTKYAEYGDNYFLQNFDPKYAPFYLSEGRTPEEIQFEIDKAKFELGIGKMPIKMGTEFSEKPTQVSEQVQSINDPVKYNSLDK